MKEVTGREATTIAGFLRNVDKSNFDDKTVLVIDEASMLDVGTMYQILQQIPSETRILLSGDKDQLASIGAGLVLHDLLKSGKTPVTELKVVNRYGGDIAKVAESVRNGFWPEISSDISKEICFIPCPPAKLQTLLTSIYSNHINNSQSIQILEPVNNGKYSSTKITNQYCQETFAKDAKKIKCWNEEFEQFERLSIREGEPVLCTRNHWDKDLQNGSLGRVINVYPEPQEQFDSFDQPLGEAYADIQWDDGQVKRLTEDLIDDVTLAYSITVHKAQGSQWDTVILPVYKCRNLDRSLL